MANSVVIKVKRDEISKMLNHFGKLDKSWTNINPIEINGFYFATLTSKYWRGQFNMSQFNIIQSWDIDASNDFKSDKDCYKYVNAEFIEM